MDNTNSKICNLWLEPTEQRILEWTNTVSSRQGEYITYFYVYKTSDINIVCIEMMLNYKRANEW